MNIINKNQSDMAAVLESEKSIWLAQVGVVPKFVAYSNTVRSSIKDMQLLALNYYPVYWSLDVRDYNSTTSEIEAKLTAAVSDVIVLHEFAESNFTATVLEWFRNTTTSPLNDLQTCFGVSTKWWDNCTSAQPATQSSGQPSGQGTPYTPVNTPASTDGPTSTSGSSRPGLLGLF